MDIQFAYFLGWMFSDGCVMKDKRCNSWVTSIVIHRQDEDVINCFSGITNWSIHYEGKENNYIRIRKNNTELAEKLKNFGVLERKSFENKDLLKIPDEISDDLFPYFLRGFIDGDGTYYWANKKEFLLHCEMVGMCVNVLTQIQEYLKRNDIESKLYKAVRSYKDSTTYLWKLRIRKKSEVKKLCDLLFKDHLEFKLNRKYNLVKTFLDNYKTVSQRRKELYKPIPPVPEEARKKGIQTRKLHVEQGLINYSMTGRRHSEETKQKMSATHKKLAQLKSGELREHPVES